MRKWLETLRCKPVLAQRFYDACTHALDDVGYLARIDGTTVRIAYGADRSLMENFVVVSR